MRLLAAIFCVSFYVALGFALFRLPVPAAIAAAVLVGSGCIIAHRMFGET